MMPISAGEFAQRVGAKLVGVAPETPLYRFVLDSREAGPGSLFIAIRGERVDGHDFALAAIRSGAVTALVEQPIGAPHILVDRVDSGLARLAGTFRKEFSQPVVGITGSAGKTSTKEFLAAALAPLGAIAKTEGNRNTEWTVPLAWAEFAGTEKAALIEMSMRGFGQISHLCSFSQPTVGIVTNIGSNHAEMVGGRAGVARAKAELFESLPENGLGIYWHETEFAEILQRALPCESATFGFSPQSDAQVVSCQAISWNESKIQVRIGETTVDASLPVAGRHFALNAAAALLVAFRLGVPLAEAAERIGKAELPKMRMQAHTVRGAHIVMDNYNAAPESFCAAIETLGEIAASGRKIVVAGSMKELGEESEEGHRRVGRALAKARLDEVIFYGDEMEAAADEFGKSAPVIRAHSLEDIREAIKEIRQGDIVLVKGSRALELERAFEVLLAEEVSHI